LAYSLLKLRLTMLGTLALVIGASTLFISLLLYLLGALSIFTVLIFVVLFNFVQWLVSPYMQKLCRDARKYLTISLQSSMKW